MSEIDFSQFAKKKTDFSQFAKKPKEEIDFSQFAKKPTGDIILPGMTVTAGRIPQDQPFPFVPQAPVQPVSTEFRLPTAGRSLAEKALDIPKFLGTAVIGQMVDPAGTLQKRAGKPKLPTIIDDIIFPVMLDFAEYIQDPIGKIKREPIYTALDLIGFGALAKTAKLSKLSKLSKAAVLAETVPKRHIWEGLISQAGNRLKTLPGRGFANDVGTVMARTGRRAGTEMEALRQAGLTRFSIRPSKAKAAGEELGHALAGESVGNAKVAGQVKEVRKSLNRMYAKARAIGLDVGYTPSYFPRMIKDDLAKLMRDDITEVLKVMDEGGIGAKISEKQAKALLRGLKPETVEAAQHLVQTGQVKDLKSAFIALERRTYFDLLRPYGNLEKSRVVDLPDYFYEWDARKVLPKYIRGWSQRISEAEMWGPRGERFAGQLKQMANIDPKEAEIAKQIFDTFTGELERTKALSPWLRTAIDTAIELEVAGKIGLGTAVIPNTVQFVISTIPKVGVYRFIRDGYKVMYPSVRSGIRKTGSLSYENQRKFVGFETQGLTRTFTNGVMTPFNMVNKAQKYIAANAIEGYVRDLHKIAGGKTRLPGLAGKWRVNWAKGELNKLGVNPTQKLTNNSIAEAQFRFATNSQLQKNVLKEPLWFNHPRRRALALFNRFFYRQANMMQEEIVDQFARGNVLPAFRLAAGGALGGEFVIWGKNGVNQFLSGEPYSYDRTDNLTQRAIENLVAVGSMGLYTDVLLEPLTRSQDDKPNPQFPRPAENKGFALLRRGVGNLRFATNAVLLADLEGFNDDLERSLTAASRQPDFKTGSLEFIEDFGRRGLSRFSPLARQLLKRFPKQKGPIKNL